MRVVPLLFVAALGVLAAPIASHAQVPVLPSTSASSQPARPETFTEANPDAQPAPPAGSATRIDSLRMTETMASSVMGAGVWNPTLGSFSTGLPEIDKIVIDA